MRSTGLIGSTRSIGLSLAVAAVLALTLVAVPALASETKADAEASWTGWITDESCGAKNANADGKACALKCHKSGAKLVLYVEADKTLVGLDNQEEAARHVGYPVTVTGTLHEGTIKVQKIKEKKG